MELNKKLLITVVISGTFGFGIGWYINEYKMKAEMDIHLEQDAIHLEKYVEKRKKDLTAFKELQAEVVEYKKYYDAMIDRCETQLWIYKKY